MRTIKENEEFRVELNQEIEMEIEDEFGTLKFETKKALYNVFRNEHGKLVQLQTIWEDALVGSQAREDS